MAINWETVWDTYDHTVTTWRDDIKQRDREKKREKRRRTGSKTYSLSYFHWNIVDFNAFPPLFFLSWRTYLTLGRLRISSLDLSAAARLLQRRWMQLKTTEGWWDSVCTLPVHVQHVRLCVLTVCQCLNLLPKASEIRLSESILSWYPLLSLKLHTHRGENRTWRQDPNWFHYITWTYDKNIDHYEPCLLPVEALRASHGHRCLFCDTERAKKQKRGREIDREREKCQCGLLVIST